jgi:LysR family nitrogen assimilation transcriptional regulator
MPIGDARIATWHGAEPAVDLRQLTAVVTVADSGSVTRAAERLHMVQPAVSRQISSLEEELGVALFERTRHGMQVTAAGQALVDRARRALNELERARAEVTPAPDYLTGIVTVGLLESVSDLLAEPLVTRIATRYPGVRLRLVTAYSGHLQQWLDQGDVDLSLLYNLRSTAGLRARPILRESLWAVAPAGAGLAEHTPIPFAQVAQHPLVMPATGHGLRTLIDAAAARAQVDMHVAAETNSLHVQKKLVLAGHGWTILPSIGASADVLRGTLSAAPVTAPEISRSIVLALPQRTRTPPAVDAVVADLLALIEELVETGSWPGSALLDR